MHKLIDKDIYQKENAFYSYLFENVFSSDIEKLFINSILKYSDALIFGGISRDYFLNNGNKIKHRDVDIVLKNDIKEIEEKYSKYLIKKTRFNGLNLKIGNNFYDIWTINDTWGIKNSSLLGFELNKFLPSTSFFNITAIVYSIKNKVFTFHKDFVKAISNKTLDITYEPNPYPELCILKTYEYMQKYNIKLYKKIKQCIFKNYKISRPN